MRGLRSMIAMAVVAALSVITAPAALASSSQLTLGVYWHNTGTTKTVTLSCDPVGGTHPDAEDACADLAKVDGDIGQIPPIGDACPTVHDPVTAYAFGSWKGRNVVFGENYPNAACANIFTGGNVFNF